MFLGGNRVPGFGQNLSDYRRYLPVDRLVFNFRAIDSLVGKIARRYTLSRKDGSGVFPYHYLYHSFDFIHNFNEFFPPLRAVHKNLCGHFTFHLRKRQLFLMIRQKVA